MDVQTINSSENKSNILFVNVKMSSMASSLVADVSGCLKMYKTETLRVADAQTKRTNL